MKHLLPGPTYPSSHTHISKSCSVLGWQSRRKKNTHRFPIFIVSVFLVYIISHQGFIYVNLYLSESRLLKTLESSLARSGGLVAGSLAFVLPSKGEGEEEEREKKMISLCIAPWQALVQNSISIFYENKLSK